MSKIGISVAAVTGNVVLSIWTNCGSGCAQPRLVTSFIVSPAKSRDLIEDLIESANKAEEMMPESPL